MLTYKNQMHISGAYDLQFYSMHATLFSICALCGLYADLSLKATTCQIASKFHETL